MMSVREIFTIIFLSLGFICFLISAIGVFRLKDFYARLHAAGVCESAGLVLCSVGFLIYEGLSLTGIKIFAVLLAVFISSPIGTHIITRVAYKQSLIDQENSKLDGSGKQDIAPAGKEEVR